MKLLLLCLLSLSAFSSTVNLSHCGSVINRDFYHSRTDNRIIILRTGILCRSQQQQQGQQQQQCQQQQYQDHHLYQYRIVKNINEVRILINGEARYYKGTLYTCGNTSVSN